MSSFDSEFLTTLDGCRDRTMIFAMQMEEKTTPAPPPYLQHLPNVEPRTRVESLQGIASKEYRRGHQHMNQEGHQDKMLRWCKGTPAKVSETILHFQLCKHAMFLAHSYMLVWVCLVCFRVGHPLASRSLA